MGGSGFCRPTTVRRARPLLKSFALASCKPHSRGLSRNALGVDIDVRASRNTHSRSKLRASHADTVARSNNQCYEDANGAAASHTGFIKMPDPKDAPKRSEWRPYIFARDQWHCRICGDRFLYSEMVRKHIANEHNETMPPSMYE